MEESIEEARYYMRLFREIGRVSTSSGDMQIGQGRSAGSLED